MKTVSLSLRKCSINGDLCTVSVRNHKDNTVKQINFKDEKEAFEQYLKLSNEHIDKKEAQEVIEEIKIEDLKEDVSEKAIQEIHNMNSDISDSINDLIIEYVRENPNNKSARHLNKKFGLKLKQVYYNELLKGL